MEESTGNVVGNAGVANVQQNVMVEGNKADLPKIELRRGERFCITLTELNELHDKYFYAISEMKEGTAFAPRELKSKMESTLDLAYSEDLERLRSKNYLGCVLEAYEQDALNSCLTPRTWRNWWWLFKVHRNQAQVLQDERIRRKKQLKLKEQAEALPILPEDDEGNETELLPFEVVIDNLYCVLPRMRKKRRALINELIEQLYDVYNGKADENKRFAAELEYARKQVSEAEEKARAAEEMLEEFLKDSTPAPDETAEGEEKPKKEQKTPEEAERAEAEPKTEDGEEPEEEQTEEEADSESADEDEEEGLSYDGLEGMDEQE